MHIMKECLSTYQISLILTKNSPLTALFNDRIQSLKAAGLIAKWIDDEMNKAGQKAKQSRIRVKSEGPLNIVDLQAIFLLIAVGLLLSVVTFVIETRLACMSSTGQIIPSI